LPGFPQPGRSSFSTLIHELINRMPVSSKSRVLRVARVAHAPRRSPRSARPVSPCGARSRYATPRFGRIDWRPVDRMTGFVLETVRSEFPHTFLQPGTSLAHRQPLNSVENLSEAHRCHIERGDICEPRRSEQPARSAVLP